MIFLPEHIQKIINGTKTETRRIAKPGERLIWNDDDNYHHFVLTLSGRIKWRVDQDYAVQPGRGKPCYVHDGKAVRIKIVKLRYSEPLRDIAVMDAWAEGVGSVTKYAQLWDSINKLPGTRWHDNPNVWVIKFEVLRQVEV